MLLYLETWSWINPFESKKNEKHSFSKSIHMYLTINKHDKSEQFDFRSRMTAVKRKESECSAGHWGEFIVGLLLYLLF